MFVCMPVCLFVCLYLGINVWNHVCINICIEAAPQYCSCKNMFRICSKFTGEHPYRKVISIEISIKLLYNLLKSHFEKLKICKTCKIKYATNFTGRHPCETWVSSCKICCMFSEHLFIRTSLEGCFSINIHFFAKGPKWSMAHRVLKSHRSKMRVKHKTIKTN